MGGGILNRFEFIESLEHKCPTRTKMITMPSAHGLCDRFLPELCWPKGVRGRAGSQSGKISFARNYMASGRKDLRPPQLTHSPCFAPRTATLRRFSAPTTTKSMFR